MCPFRAVSPPRPALAPPGHNSRRPTPAPRLRGLRRSAPLSGERDARPGGRGRGRAGGVGAEYRKKAQSLKFNLEKNAELRNQARARRFGGQRDCVRDVGRFNLTLPKEM